jgi:hypothetical protein
VDEDKFNKEGYEQLLKDMAQNTLIAGPLGGGMSFMAAQASFKPLTKEEKTKIERYQEVVDSETASNDVKKIAQAKLDAINNGASIKAEENYDKVMELPLEERVLVMDKMNKVKSLEAEYETLSDMDMKDSVIERISQLDEEINFALNPKEAEVQGSARGIESLKDVESTAKALESLPKDKDGNIEGIELSPLDLENEGIVTWDRKDNKSVAEAYHKAKADDTNPELVNAVEKLLGGKPKVGEGVATDKAAENIATPETLTTQENVPDVLISDIIDKRVTMNGKNGNLYQEENGLVVFNEDGGRKTEIGNINDISDSPISDFKIDTQESVVGADKNGNITVRGESYINPYSNPTAAINYDNKGNVVSVNMETSNGSKRAFRGNIAEDVAYQIHLKEISKDNERLNSFEEYINSEQGQQEINDGEIQGAAETGTKQSDAVVPEKAVTTPSETIKNPAPSVLPNIPASTKPVTLQDQVDQLRADEQAEYDAMSDPNNEAARKKIYDKYDEKITPLLKEIEKANTKADEANVEQVASTTPEQAAKESEKMYKDSEDAIIKSGRRNYWTLFKKLVGNRKTNIEKVITATEKGIFANAAVENVSGSMSYADEQFMEARKRLYARALMKIDKRFGKMSISINKAITNINAKAKQALDEVMFHRRVIEIYSRTDKKNKKLDAEIAQLGAKKKSTTSTLEKAKISEELKKLKSQRKDRIEHPRGFNKELSEAAIEGIKERIGTEAFNDIEKRANTYFEIRGEILDKMVEEGLISKDSAYNLSGDDYIERRFLEYILEDHKSYGQSNSLSSAQIKSLSEGSTGLVLMDSEVLLHAAYRSIENRVAQNKANRALAEAVSEQKFDKSVVMPAEFEKNLNGKYKTDKYGNRVLKPAPNGFELIPFYENGEKSGVYMRTNEASEWNDSVKIQVMIGDISVDNIFKTVFFVKTLKFFATLANPLFAYGNMFRDFAKVLFLSSTYDNNILTAAPRLLANFSNKVTQYTALKTSGIASDNFRQLVDDYTKYGGKFEFLHKDGKSSNLYKNTLNKKRYLIQKIGGGAYNLFENALGFPGEISEISMRLAVFEKTRDTLIDKYGGKSSINAAQMADINILAANASRAIMDYNKGGLATKWLDNFSPYLNASVVGFVSDVNYIKKNPKKFAAKIAMFGANVAAITLYNLMNSDEEDRKNIPDYIKNNNFVFFIPGKNKDGKKEYRTVPKYQGLQPFASMFEESTEIAYNMYIEKPQKKVGEIADRLQETISTWSPIPASMRGLMLKMPPLVQASYAYYSNYDLFRDSKIEYRQGKVPTKDEGLDNDKTARTYRVLGQMSSKLGDGFAISPSRAQNFTEKLITSPTTNFVVGGIYGITDWITQEHQIPREIKEAKPSTVKASVKNKFIREVDPEYLAKFKSKSNTIEQEITAESEFQQKTIKLMVSNGEPKDKIVDFIKGLNTSPEVKVTRLKKAADLIATKDDAKTVPFYGELMDVKYIDGLTFPTPEDKAVKAFDRFGGVDPNSEDFLQIIESAKKLKVITKGVSEERFRREYQRIFAQNQTEGKRK